MISELVGGIMGVVSANKQDDRIDAQRSKNERWYDRRYNEDSLQRSDAAAAVGKMRDLLGETSASDAGRAAVMGGSTASVAAAKGQSNAALGSLMSNIASGASARKDTIENSYMSRDSQLDNMSAQNDVARNNAWANIGAGVDGGIDLALGRMDKKNG
ncbi:MAG: hypothetical protein R3Y22_07845 [Bacteroidales bacterium]